MTEQSFYTFELPNGLRVIHLPSTGSDVVHCGLIINAGSRDEDEHEQGLAHFIEHALFKGTQKRKPYHILSGLDAVGGELNAYTTKEYTAIYASFQQPYFERAVELIGDITFNATFPEKELVKEKAVIIDEIYSYLDSPSEQIFDDFEEQLFAGHPIGRNILGTLESVERMRREDVIAFRKRHFTTDNMVLSIVGDVPAKKVQRVVEKHLSTHATRKTPLPRHPFSAYQPRHLTIDRNAHQLHCVLGNIAYPAQHPKNGAMVLLDNIIGGPAMNSLLNLEIRERYGFTYNLDSSYTPYSDTGMFAVYFGTDQKHADRTRTLILNILKRLREKKLGVRQLSTAKKQLIGQMALNRENRVNVMLALGKSLLMYDKVATDEEMYRKIEGLTAEDLQETANEVLEPSQISSLTYPAGSNA